MIQEIKLTASVLKRNKIVFSSKRNGGSYCDFLDSVEAIDQKSAVS